MLMLTRIVANWLHWLAGFLATLKHFNQDPQVVLEILYN